MEEDLFLTNPTVVHSDKRSRRGSATSGGEGSPVELKQFRKESFPASGRTPGRTPELPKSRLHAESKATVPPISEDHQVELGGGSEYDSGRFFLLEAAFRGDVKRIRQLLGEGVNPSSADYDKRTALHVAACEGKLLAVKLLVDHGANVNARDRFGTAPLDDAVRNGHIAVANYLKERNAKFMAQTSLENDLRNFASVNDVEKARILLSQGVNPNTSDYDKRTPLHIAVAEGHAEMVSLLLEYNAAADVEDRFGLTPWEDVKRREPRVGPSKLRTLFVQAKAVKEEAVRVSGVAYLLGISEIIIIILFALFTRFDAYSNGKGAITETTTGNEDKLKMYPFFQDVHVMIFVGFGYLMTFLRKHSYTSLGLTFLISAITIQWYILCRGFWANALEGGHWHKIELNVESLVRGDFAAGAVMITYGVLLGKVSPSQMLFISFFETIFYTLNEEVGLHHKIAIADIGGSMIIHMFGAFFGLTVALVGIKKNIRESSENAAVYHSDIFAMIGTVFLWLFWPSFNAALGMGKTQHRAILNTLLGMTGSCISAFTASHIFRGSKFSMVDIQNATLAGGVALGTVADIMVDPVAAICVGSISGFLSVVGYVFIQPYLARKIGLADTCGVMNLHGMPSLIGAIAGIIAAAQAENNFDIDQRGFLFPEMGGSDPRSQRVQALYQFIYMVITLATAIFTGAFAGLLMNLPIFDPPQRKEETFLDSRYWEVPELEMPYYFDHRGEVQRESNYSHDPYKADEKRTSVVGAYVPALVKELEERIAYLEASLDKQKQSQVVMPYPGYYGYPMAPPPIPAISTPHPSHHHQSHAHPHSYSPSQAQSNNASVEAMLATLMAKIDTLAAKKTA